jgi:hypothetical protein
MSTNTKTREPAAAKPVKQNEATVTTRADKRDERTLPEHWVERPDWHGAGVVGENHTD